MKKAILVCLTILVAVASAQSFWTDRKLVTTRPNWDYWWLNVRIGVDQFDTVYCAVSRYNYSQDDPKHDLYVLNSDGDTMRSMTSWPGYFNQPIIKDADSNNIYVGQPLMGQGPNSSPHMDAGVTDDSNCVSTTNAHGSSIKFTRLGPNGDSVIWLQTIHTGNPWTGRSSLAIDPRGWLHCAYADSMQYLEYGFSTDRGATWTWDRLDNIRVMSHARVVATPDTCVHFVYRTWTSGDQLRYLKLKSDGSVAVGGSIFSQGGTRWCPNVAVDTSGNLRVVFGDGSTSGHNVYYTVLRGDLDNGGDPVPDSILTLVPDTIIQYDAVRVAGPKICVDSRDRAHVMFEQGTYGRHQTKNVYHIREGLPGAVAERPVLKPKSMLTVSPNPVCNRTTVRFSLSKSGPVRLSLYDVSGRRAMGIAARVFAAGSHSVSMQREELQTGAYFLVLETGTERQQTKLVVTD